MKRALDTSEYTLDQSCHASQPQIRPKKKILTWTTSSCSVEYWGNMKKKRCGIYVAHRESTSETLKTAGPTGRACLLSVLLTFTGSLNIESRFIAAHHRFISPYVVAAATLPIEKRILEQLTNGKRSKVPENGSRAGCIIRKCDWRQLDHRWRGGRLSRCG